MDAQIDGLQRIAQGEQSITVYKPIQPLAFVAVEVAVKLFKKEKVETNKTMKAVNKEIPFIFIDQKIIGKSNLMEIVNDGYQKFDDIFANVLRIKDRNNSNHYAFSL